MSTSKRSKLHPAIRDTRTYYNTYADVWAREKTNAFYHEMEFTQFRALLPEKGSLVDIGCANGTLVPLCLGIGHGLRYHGIEIANSFLKIARRRYPHLTFTLGDITESATLPRKPFDAFLAVAVLMHIPEELWDTAFGNIERMIKPRGYGYVTLPLTHPSGSALRPTDTRHMALKSEAGYRGYMKARGWTVIKKWTRANPKTQVDWVRYIVQLP